MPMATRISSEDDDDDDDDDQANLSLAAMETALKPQVLETLDRIADDYVQPVRDAGQSGFPPR